jgi:hypothetical protein
MTSETLYVDVTDRSINVRLDVAPRARFYACIFFLAVGAIVICGLLFPPGKGNRPSMWHDLSSSPASSGNFIVPLILLLSAPALMGLLLWRYIMLAYPSAETFHCDGVALTLSKVRWLDIQNKHWDTRSYPLAEIAEMKYQAIARAKGRSVYGLRFIADGKVQRVLPGLKPSEADRILTTLRAFGADVRTDPTLSRELADEVRTRM